MVIKDIEKFPQTYDSILKELSNNGTCQTIVRRKLNKLCKSGIVHKTNIPGTRFGKVIFYTLPKDYNILIEAGRLGSKVFCFFKYKRLSRYYIEVEECWQLKEGHWKQGNGSKRFFDGDVLKWV